MSVLERNAKLARAAIDECPGLTGMDTDYEPLPEDFKPIFATEKAVMVEIDGDSTWLPLSHIRIDKDGVYIPTWLFKEKGL